MPHIEQPAHPAEHPAVRASPSAQDHEHSDVNVRGVAIALAVLVVVAVATHVGLYFLFGVYEREERATQRPRSAIRTDEVRIPRATPRLQGIPGFHEPTPMEDTKRMLQEHRRRLHGYGSADREGYVRIPMDRAMELALQRDLFPTAATRPAAEKGGARVPTSP